jgi:hypothetical protein
MPEEQGVLEVSACLPARGGQNKGVLEVSTPEVSPSVKVDIGHHMKRPHISENKVLTGTGVFWNAPQDFMLYNHTSKIQVRKILKRFLHWFLYC